MAIHIGRPDTAPLARARLIAACRRGDEPAELLSAADRARLVRWFWRLGWTDVEIAQHTSMTTYTTGRIRARLGLAAHPTSTKGAA
ncbi:hypothetical protein [Amycolatopsis sp. NPDC051128]|uniref:hypothetical protein n=1 Tax=Amycolatopsis sp. NPDC051128 TaxID=3155412 RepID=UPI00343B44DD